MDSDSDNVAETDKYAFLLGSAIRVEDTDQFFSIYDSILPPDLPDSQVEIIKEKARGISELPEDTFNSLVCQARNFSLAPAGVSMSCPRPPTTHKSRYSYEEEDEGVGSTRMACIHGGKSDELSSCFSLNTMKMSARSSESETRRVDEDSGVYNSSKATSIGSWTDENGSDDEREAADFDYFPPQIKISSGRPLYYDEVHDVETESSNEDVNSPRSDFDHKENRYDGEDGLEMTTISSSNEDMPRRSIFQDDFNTSGDSDEDCGRAFNYYSYPTKPKTTCSYTPKFDTFAHTPTSSLRKGAHVDDTISFRTLEEGTPTVSRYAPYQEYGTMSNHSDRVKVEKSSYKIPPFGSGDPLSKVAHSITPLLSGLSGTEAPTDMPPARKLEVLKADETKKKKKKKKNDQVDENGNPVSLSKDKYKQMREAPPPVIASGKSRPAFDTRPSSNSDGCFELTHRESENDHYKAQEKRKRKKVIKEEVKKSEEIENYVGNKSIEELVDFIGGNNAGVKKAKKPVSTNSEHIPAKTNKVAKKSKDKKQKPATASSSLDKVDPKAEDSAIIDSFETESEEQKNMGNSGAKTEIHFDEDKNSVNEIMLEKKIIKNDLLKENDKKMKNAIIASAEIDEKKSEFEKDSSKEKEDSKQTKLPEVQIEDEVVSEQKKKSDKNNKIQKKDKIEKSKSDELVKSNPNSSVQSVKQKNAKNKKTKPSNSSQKVESHIGNEIVNHEISSISTITNDVLVDSKFIFTDIDLQAVPKEDEFRVVEKKKKKPAKEVQNHYVTVSANNNKPASRFIEDKRSLPPSSSNTLTTSDGSYMTKCTEIDTRIRDLSPSAFPALSNGKGRMQDGRRNSTGDVPIPSEIALKTQDDSDLESVKSLPATQGSRAADTLISPRLNMSYAKMAASPKQRGEGHDEKNSGFVDQDEPERKMAVWKGSPTERRHSIGSSPNGNIGSVDNSNATSSTVKGGSQEMLNIDPLPSKVDSSIATKGQGNSTNVSSKELNDSHVSKTKDYNIYENQITAKNCANLISSSVQSSGLSHKCDAELTSNNNRNTYNVNTKTKINSDSHSVKTSKNISNSKSLSTSRKTKPCSVIFLDKRLAEPTNNLGITFGFEYDLGDKDIVIEGELSGDKIVTTGNTESRKDSTTHSVEPTVTFLSDLEDEILSTDQTSSDNSSSANVINVIRENTNTSRDLVHKVAAHVGQLNGVVKASQGQQGHATDKVNEIVSKGASNSDVTDKVKEVQSNSASVDTVETSLQDANYYKRSKNEVVVYYGENVSTVSKNVSVPSLTNGPTHYCGKLIFVPEVEVRRGTFNTQDAVAFLTGEWDVTLLSKDADNSVKVHTEQGAI